MHGAQAQAFGQQQAYGQQISSRMPGAYPGLGATGFGGGFGNYTGYSYGNNTQGYGPGNSFGNTMTSAIGGVGHAVGSGMGIAGGVGGYMMGGIGGAMTGFAAGGLVGAGVKYVANQFMEGAHEQSQIERTLSQFQFNNPAAQGGKGFTRSDSMQIGNMVRQMERMPEMLTSFGELNKLMDKMGQMGLMQGVRDAGEFMRKFRDTTATLKDMAKMMGTTMEGALKTFGEARMSGFYSQGDISRNVLQRQVVAGVSGMNQGQIGGLQMYGAEMAHSLGGSRAGGARNMLRTAGQLGMANQMGILTNDQIMEMTGKEGAEGIQDLSANMSQLSYKMGRSNVGQALTLALGRMENGRYTGEMDQELVEKVRRGELSLSELKSMARSKASTRGAKLSFAAHKDRLRTEMAGSVGSEGISMQLQEILGDRGWNNPDATNLVMQRFGASEEQANLLQKMMPNLQNIGSQMNLATKQQARDSARNAAMSEHGWDAIKHNLGKKIEAATGVWAKDLGKATREYFQDFADDFMDDITGQYREYVTKRVADAAKYSMAGSAGNRSSLQAMSARAAKLTQNSSGLMGAGRLDIGGVAQERGGAFQLTHEATARIGHWLGGGQSAGERAVDVLGGLDKGAFLERGQVSDLKDQGATVLDSSYWSRSGVGINQNDARQALKRFTQINTEKGGLNEWNRTMAVTKNFSGNADGALREAYQRAMARGDVQLETDPSKKADKVWEEMRKSMPKELLHTLEKSGLGRHNIMAGVQAAEAKAGNVYKGSIDFEALGKGALGGLDLKNQAAIGREIEGMDKRLGKILGGSETAASWGEIKKLADSGSQMMTLLTGNEKYRGLAADTKHRKGTWSDISGLTLQKLAAKDPSNWTEDDRKVLKDMGVDAVKLAEEINKDPKAWSRLQEAARSGKLSGDDLAKYLTMTEASGLNKITSEMNKQGSELASRLKGDNYKSAIAQLKKTEGGAEVISMLESQAKSLQGADLTNLGSYTDSTASIAGRIAGMKDKKAQQMALELGGDELRSVYSYRKDLKRKLHGGMSADDILGAGGIKLGFTDADQAFKKDLEGMLHGKGGKLSDKDMEGVLNMISGVKAGDLRAKAGTEGNSAYMSEQDVSNNLKTLSENNLKATQILANLAAGKTGKNAMEGVK